MDVLVVTDAGKDPSVQCLAVKISIVVMELSQHFYQMDVLGVLDVVNFQNVHIQNVAQILHVHMVRYKPFYQMDVLVVLNVWKNLIVQLFTIKKLIAAMEQYRLFYQMDALDTKDVDNCLNVLNYIV